MLAAYIYTMNMLADAQRYLLTPKKGQGLVEYVLIVLLIALAAFTAMQLLGGNITSRFTNAQTKLNQAAPTT